MEILQSFQPGNLDGMLNQLVPEKLNDLFLPLSDRRPPGVYFCRLAGYSPAVGDFLKRYYDAARRAGVIIDGRIPNPDTGNLAYFSEMLGTEFRLDRAFLEERLGRWLPRMAPGQREIVAAAIFSTLQDMLRGGKNENMLRNAYIKYMCWLYYKFERIVNQLGGDALPKILYDGVISHYELQLLAVLSRAGADIVLMADDDRFVAYNTVTGTVADNARCTALGYSYALRDAAGGLAGREVLVMGAGFVGSEAVRILRDMHAMVSVADIDTEKASRLATYEGVGWIEDVREAISTHRLILNATPGTIPGHDMMQGVIVSSPGVPYSFDEEARRRAKAIIHDPLEIGAAVMLTVAVSDTVRRTGRANIPAHAPIHAQEAVGH